MHTTEHVPDNDIYFLFPLGVIGFTRVQNLEMLVDLRGKLFELIINSKLFNLLLKIVVIFFIIKDL